MEKAVSKYLQLYAEPEVALLDSLPAFDVGHCCVVPCYRESAAFFRQYFDTFENSSTLLVAVVNQPDCDAEIKPQLGLVEKLKQDCQPLWQQQHLTLLRRERHYLLLIQRFEEGWRIPKKQGVGLARKIGADCALACIVKQRVSSSWIFSTDADAQLPQDYFNIGDIQGLAAGTFQFEHLPCGETDIDQATQLYQQHLHYYVAGLRWAGSRYAFHTIGSCLAFSANAYAQSRGFPKKAAGEDFYLLNKLAKLGGIGQFKPKVELTSRLSKRVPFGTGPAVADIIELMQSGRDYCSYAPDCFELLKALLQAFDELWQQREQLEPWLNGLPFLASQYLAQQGFITLAKGWIKQSKSQSQFEHLLHCWFDAFRTLKFIHHCRGLGYPDIPLHQALLQAKFINNPEQN